MSKVEELKKYFSKTITPDDIIMALLSEMKGNYIPKDPEIIHRAMYELKQEAEYKDLLKEFRFDVSGLTPFSDLLDRVLFRLEAACILGTINPRFKKYELATEQKENLAKRISIKFADQKSIISKASDRFEKIINN